MQTKAVPTTKNVTYSTNSWSSFALSIRATSDCIRGPRSTTHEKQDTLINIFLENIQVASLVVAKRIRSSVYNRFLSNHLCYYTHLQDKNSSTPENQYILYSQLVISCFGLVKAIIDLLWLAKDKDETYQPTEAPILL